jgi:hypothetical protein
MGADSLLDENQRKSRRREEVTITGDRCIMFMNIAAYCSLPFLSYILILVYVAKPPALNIKFLSARLSYDKTLSKLPSVDPKHGSCESDQE